MSESAFDPVVLFKDKKARELPPDEPREHRRTRREKPFALEARYSEEYFKMREKAYLIGRSKGNAWWRCGRYATREIAEAVAAARSRKHNLYEYRVVDTREQVE